MLCFSQARAHALRASLIALVVSSFAVARAEDAPKAATEAKPATAAAATSPKSDSKFPDWNKTVEGAKQIDGLFTLFYNEKDQKLLMAIRREQYNQEFVLPISIARGAGMMYLGGDTLNFGEQWILSFQRAADHVLVVRRDVRHRAEAGSPQADSVKVSYNDSVINSLPIKSEEHGGNRVLVDLADLFMSDLAGLGIHPDRNRSTWVKVKSFPENIEIEVSAVFNFGFGWFFFYGDSGVVDPRGTQIVIHYGLSKLPTSSYKSRLADDRVGHFLSTVQDFSTDVRDTPQVRYVTRWDLEKSNASAERSTPKKPILFWIEKTVPREYRPYVRAGILEWNKAFDKLGYIEAIQVRDQSELDDFDPEDIRYNTFRWITTSAGFAMGPSRTNPKTGQILDADIIFDEGMIRYWRGEFVRTRGIPEAMSLLHQGNRQAFFKIFSAQVPEMAANEGEVQRLFTQYQTALKESHAAHPDAFPGHATWQRAHVGCDRCMMGEGMQRQIGLMAAMMAAQGTIDPGGKVPEEFLGQAIKEVVMHEVGHTLGLRHNFKSSTFISLKDANNPEITRKKGMTGSVMDYAPANFAPKGEKQGDYFSDTLGPYDYWAIEYAYKPTKDEATELAAIAAKSSAPDLVYGTDEDTFLNPDPRINLFDLGDPLEFAQFRVQLVKDSLDKLTERVVAKGEGWQRARQAFSMLLGELNSATYLSSQYIGGEYTARAHREDPDAKTPFETIPLAKQREAIKILREEILSDQAFKFSPELLKRLAPEHFRDGYFYSQYEFPIYDRVLSIQKMVLSRFFDPSVMRTIQNAELHASAGQEVLKLPELFDVLTETIWKELPTADQPAGEKKKIELSTIRRNLQREHVKRLATMVIGPKQNSNFLFADDFIFFGFVQPPLPDARALARKHIKAIDDRIARALDAQVAEPDAYSRAHLEQLHDEIAKVLAAPLQMNDL
ncbi:MAG TPA: zinc-dependent metalloprotease [Pirellulales bacterium]|nr:zinc-dependent metalloprotease [Pirellulales bacterium]